jgi:hypothetical protein
MGSANSRASANITTPSYISPIYNIQQKQTKKERNKPTNKPINKKQRDDDVLILLKEKSILTQKLINEVNENLKYIGDNIQNNTPYSDLKIQLKIHSIAFNNSSIPINEVLKILSQRTAIMMIK